MFWLCDLEQRRKENASKNLELLEQERNKVKAEINRKETVLKDKAETDLHIKAETDLLSKVVEITTPTNAVEAEEALQQCL